jgi:hypothetical protein
LFFSANAFAQSDSKIWIGVDGSFWQKSIKGSISPQFDSEFSRSIRPMIGYQFNEKWFIGVLTNFQNYRIDEGFGSFVFYDFQTDLLPPSTQTYNQTT